MRDRSMPPESDPGSPPERSPEHRRAHATLRNLAMAALGLALLQFCCNPIGIVTTVIAAGASMNALQRARWTELADEGDVPEGAVRFARVSGYVGIALCVLYLLLRVVGVVLLTTR